MGALTRLRRIFRRPADGPASLEHPEELAAFLDELARELARALRYGRPLSLLVCRVDGLAAFGRRQGVVMWEVERLVRGNVRSLDQVARSAIDEFLVLMPETDAEGVAQAGERLQEAVGRLRLREAPRLRLALQIGTASLPPEGATVEELLHAADQAVYRAARQAEARA